MAYTANTHAQGGFLLLPLECRELTRHEEMNGGRLTDQGYDRKKGDSKERAGGPVEVMRR